MNRIQYTEGDVINGVKFLSDVPSPGNGRRAIFKCYCGETFNTQIQKVKSGHTKSCGCYFSKKLSERNKTHGFCRNRLFPTWRAMISRCENQSVPNYHRYGGRGIKVCERWQTFENFLADMNSSYESGLTLDRIDNDGNYCPENCRWATDSQQMNNTRANVLLEYCGEKYTMAQLSRKVGIERNVIKYRLQNGFSVQEALEKPIETKYRRNTLRTTKQPC